LKFTIFEVPEYGARTDRVTLLVSPAARMGISHWIVSPSRVYGRDAAIKVVLVGSVSVRVMFVVGVIVAMWEMLIV
jgi:hypothetical protein